LISLEIIKNKKLALLSAGLFTFYPYIIFEITKLANFTRAIPVFHYQMWVSIAADYLSAILVYSGFYLFIKKFNAEKLNIVAIIAISAFLSSAALVRVANILYLPVIFFILIWLKKYKESFIFGTVSFLIYLPQWIYNFYFFGSPLMYGYRVPLLGFDAGTKILGDWLSFGNAFIFFSKIWQNFSASVWILPILILIIIVGFWKLFKQNKILSLVLILWAALNVGFYIFFIAAQSQLRYFIPSIPPLIILLIFGIYSIIKSWRNRLKSL